jgi:dephospho-CoA kinase
MARNNLSREQAEQRIRAQMPQEEKRRFGDYLIDTSDGFEATQSRTEEVYQELRRLVERFANDRTAGTRVRSFSE